MDKTDKTQSLHHTFWVLVFLALIFIRFVYLDADPSFLKRVGDIQDEGYWIHNARTAVLFNNWVTDDMTQSLFLAPLFSVMLYASFKLFGVSFWSARIISVFFSVFTLIALYYLVKSAFPTNPIATGKRIAYGGVLLLGISNAYIIYNKMALVETTLGFFLLMTMLCWYLQEKSAWYSLLSGLFFTAAVLVKVTAVYFAPVFIMLIVIDILLRRFSFKKTAIFCACIATLLSLYTYFVFIPRWQYYKLHFLTLMQFDHKGFWDILASPFHLLSNNFFGDPGTFLLYLLFLFYLLLVVSRFRSNSSDDELGGKQNMLSQVLSQVFSKVSYLELLALSWIVGGAVGLMLSNMHDRRFLMFLIPGSILASIVYHRGEDINIHFKELTQRMFEWLHKGIGHGSCILLVLLFPVVSLMYTAVDLWYGFHYDNAFVNILFIIIFIGLSALFYLFFRYAKFHGKKYAFQVFSFLIQGSLAFVLLIPTLTLVRNLTHHLIIMLNLQRNELLIIAVASVAAAMVMLWVGILFLRRDGIPARYSRILVGAYVVVNILLIGMGLMYPSYTLRDVSREIGKYVAPGEIIAGSSPHLLAVENLAVPYIYAPHNRDYQPLNQNTKSKHKYVLVVAKYDGKVLPADAVLTSDYQKITFLAHFNLYPYPNGRVKNEMNLYRIDIS